MDRWCTSCDRYRILWMPPLCHCLHHRPSVSLSAPAHAHPNPCLERRRSFLNPKLHRDGDVRSLVRVCLRYRREKNSCFLNINVYRLWLLSIFNLDHRHRHRTSSQEGLFVEKQREDNVNVRLLVKALKDDPARDRLPSRLIRNGAAITGFYEMREMNVSLKAVSNVVFDRMLSGRACRIVLISLSPTSSRRKILKGIGMLYRTSDGTFPERATAARSWARISSSRATSSPSSPLLIRPLSRIYFGKASR